ncbi:MAG: helix-turn-helix domain-containing protein, partial [Bacteroidales bacterium]|nr:helix-turn-helix domain-containing protein [Bacteroidales bacterium]
MLFADRIKKLREKKQMVQRQFAAALETDTPMYSKIERGDRRATTLSNVLGALLNAFKES